jgi:hypothetical protein
MCLLTERFLTLLIYRNFWGLLFLQHFVLSKCVRLFACDVMESLSNVGRSFVRSFVRSLSFHIQKLVMCLLWKATWRKLSVVQKYQDVKIIWAAGTNTKTQSITLVVHVFCCLVYVGVRDCSVCDFVYWQPWPFWFELYATGQERHA